MHFSGVVSKPLIIVCSLTLGIVLYLLKIETKILLLPVFFIVTGVLFERGFLLYNRWFWATGFLAFALGVYVAILEIRGK